MGDSAAPAVSRALADVETWRKTAEEASKREMEGLDQEAESLRSTIQNLMQQLEALKGRRDALEAQVAHLDEVGRLQRRLRKEHAVVGQDSHGVAVQSGDCGFRAGKRPPV